MYKLNNNEISEVRAIELIEDLAMFSLDHADIEISIEERKEKYREKLAKTGELKLSDSLILTYE